MITFKCITSRFKAGESMARIAYAMTFGRDPLRRNYKFNLHYVERAIRQVMQRQHARHYGKRRQPVGGATVSTSGGRLDQPRRTPAQVTTVAGSSSPFPQRRTK